MNSLQLKNIAAPIVAIIVAWLSRKVPFIDPATWGMLIDALIAAVTAGVLGYFNRGSAVAASAQALPGVTVNTSPAAGTAVVDAVDAAKANG